MSIDLILFKEANGSSRHYTWDEDGIGYEHFRDIKFLYSTEGGKFNVKQKREDPWILYWIRKTHATILSRRKLQ